MVLFLKFLDVSTIPIPRGDTDDPGTITLEGIYHLEEEPNKIFLALIIVGIVLLILSTIFLIKRVKLNVND